MSQANLFTILIANIKETIIFEINNLLPSTFAKKNYDGKVMCFDIVTEQNVTLNIINIVETQSGWFKTYQVQSDNVYYVLRFGNRCWDLTPKNDSQNLQALESSNVTHFTFVSHITYSLKDEIRRTNNENMLTLKSLITKPKPSVSKPKKSVKFDSDTDSEIAKLKKEIEALKLKTKVKSGSSKFVARRTQIPFNDTSKDAELALKIHEEELAKKGQTLPPISPSLLPKPSNGSHVLWSDVVEN
jgi:hypothetical protein